MNIQPKNKNLTLPNPIQTKKNPECNFHDVILHSLGKRKRGNYVVGWLIESLYFLMAFVTLAFCQVQGCCRQLEWTASQSICWSAQTTQGFTQSECQQ